MIHALDTYISRAKLNVEKKCALVISDSSTTVTEIDNILTSHGFNILVASECKQAFSLFVNEHIDYIVIDLDSIDMPGDELVYSLRVRLSDNLIPIIVIAPAEQEEILSDCLSAGCDDFLLKPFSSVTLAARLASMDQVYDLKRLYKDSINEQLVAKQILSYALFDRNVEFEEIKVLSKSKAVFSGDLFLTARSPDGGVHVFVGDFTGHGLSAAIGSLPVADMFRVMTEKGFEIADIVESINNKLLTLLPVSMFMACAILKVHNDLEQVSIWSGGMPEILIRDGKTGEITQKIHAAHIALGITEMRASQYAPQTVITQPEDQLIVYSDGLTEAVNYNGDMFGDEQFENCINNHKLEKSIFSFLVDGFNNYCGGINPDDDVTLACIPCTSNLTEIHDTSSLSAPTKENNLDDGWFWYLELSGSSLRNLDPATIVMGEVYKMFGQSVSEEKLSSVLNSLVDNANRYGLSGVIGNHEDTDKEMGDSQCSNKYLRIGLKKIEHEGSDALLLSLEDSGSGFDHASIMGGIKNQLDNNVLINAGIPLVNEICDSLNYYGTGNRVEAIINVQM